MKMNTTLVQPNSPLAQIRRRSAVAVKPSGAPMSPREQAELKAILSDEIDYVDDEAFEKAGAHKAIFEDAAEVPTPNTSWYHPVMEDLATDQHAKTVVNVVLTAEQERVLFLQFNYARFRAREVQKRIGDAEIDPADARELLKWHRLSMHLRDRIAQFNLALVLAMAKRVRMSEMDFADLISEGNMALLRAIDKFNVSKGFKFSTYACRAILKAFSRSGMKHSKYRQMFPTDFDPKLERSDYAERKLENHEKECADEVRRIVQSNEADLTDVEKAVIHHRFAIDRREAEGKPLTLEQVGRIVGLTKERVRQIQNKALEKIRVTLEERYLDGARPAEIALGEEDAA